MMHGLLWNLCININDDNEKNLVSNDFIFIGFTAIALVNYFAIRFHGYWKKYVDVGMT